MSLRDDTSRHLGIRPERGRRHPVALAGVVVFALLITVAALHRASGADGWQALEQMRVTSDEGYLYLLLQTAGTSETPDWNHVLYRIAIDTYAPQLGEGELPQPYPVDLPTRAEFMLEIAGPKRAAIYVTPTYNPFPNGKMVEGRPVVSPQKPSGTFERLMFETNRERIARDGKRFPPLLIDRGVLRFRQQNQDARTAQRVDVAFGKGGVIEMRIPWSILNVADPSSRRVLHGLARAEDSPTRETEGFRLYAYAFDARRSGKGPIDQLPGKWRKGAMYTWDTWDEPKYKLQLKAGARILAATMKTDLTDP